MKKNLSAFSLLMFFVFSGCAKKMNPGETSSENSSIVTDQCTERIVFYSSRSNNGDLYTFDPITLKTNEFVIADSAIGAPVYSSLSNSLVFAQQGSNGRNLFSKNLTSGNTEFLVSNPAGDEVPDWSPTEQKFVYSFETKPQNYSLIVKEIDTGNELILYENAKQSYDPVWSPDGSRIAFVLTDSLFNADIAIINSDGSGFINLTNNSKLNGHPGWSPDGNNLLFYIYQNGDADLFILEIATRGLTQLTFDSSNQLIGRFSSDGKKIAYGGIIDDDWEVFTMDSDGNNKERVTFNPGFDGDPVWIPCN